MHKGELKNGEEVVHYTLEEFIKDTRPDGNGHIVIHDMSDDAPPPTDIVFSEVVCDFCNDEITQPDDNPEKEVVHIIGSYALCDDCFATTDKDEVPEGEAGDGRDG